MAALEEGVADVAVLFSTDGHLGTGDFVLLADDRGLQPAENVVPVVSRRALDRWGAQVTSALDAVSARLTSNALTLPQLAGLAGRSGARRRGARLAAPPGPRSRAGP